MASGWNLWVWLVSVVVRRYIIDILIIIITFPYSTCISSFFGSIIPISLFIFKCFFVLIIIIIDSAAQTRRIAPLTIIRLFILRYMRYIVGGAISICERISVPFYESVPT